MNNPPKLKIADREFESRLLIGTGKFASNFLMRDALEASGTQLVTVALRRANLSGGHDPFADILDYIDPARYLILPNTSGAMTAERGGPPCPARCYSRSAKMGQTGNSPRSALSAARSDRNIKGSRATGS